MRARRAKWAKVATAGGAEPGDAFSALSPQMVTRSRRRGLPAGEEEHDATFRLAGNGAALGGQDLGKVLAAREGFAGYAS